MKKSVILILICLSLFVTGVLYSCTNKNDDKPTITAGTKAPEATPKATTNPTKEPKEEVRTADVGYYHEETRTSLVKGVEYINLFGTRIYYTIPNEKTYIPLEGNASDWKVKSDDFGIVKYFYEEDDKLYIEASSTGYCYFKNSSTGEIAKLYVNEAVKKIKQRKQENTNLPYYLYLEKGSYTDFQEGTIALTVYRVDDTGYYTIPYLTICTACGSMSSKTPIGYHTIGGSDVGSFSMSGREYWHDWGGGQYGQYAINYSSGVYLHGPTGDGKKEGQCIAGSYNQVGTHASGGCLRMQVGSIYWIWTNCPNGTTLEIVDKNPRGTCIEKAAMVSSNGHIYDPTDPYLLTKEHNS